MQKPPQNNYGNRFVSFEKKSNQYYNIKNERYSFLRQVIFLEIKLNKREAKKLKSKNTIINSAIKLFGTKGLKDTSIADIMQDADLGIGTFYNYFQSKDELLNNLLTQIAFDIRQYFVKLTNENSSQAQILEAIVIYSAKVLDHNRFILPLFMRAVDKSALTVQHHSLMQKPLPFKDLFDEIIQSGQANGEFRTDIPAEIITEMFHSLFQTASFSSLPIKYQDNIRYKLNLILTGIKTR